MLPSDYQTYIAKSRYARYLPSEKRRETWGETVDRYVSYFGEKYPDTFPVEEIRKIITDLEVMPSMRSVMTAGKALDRDNASGFNCSYLAVDDQRAFDETMYLLMNGVGVGFSVERQFISKLPSISEEFFDTDSVIVVKDSKIGWASALKELISLLYQGLIPKWDLSLVRPAGAPLKVFGGRASGPEPLNELFHFFVTTFKYAIGRKLNSIECNDLLCKIGEAVVVGGVRRCLPSDTLVQIDKNEWKEMDKLTINDSIYLDGEYQKIENIFDQGIQNVMKIELEDGSFLESTENHKWLVWNKSTEDFEWVKTMNLNENHAMIDPN